MNNQNKYLIIVVICLILFVLVGFFLINNFRKIQLEGVSCISNPLVYAENKLLEQNYNNYVCQCKQSNFINYINNDTFG